MSKLYKIYCNVHKWQQEWSDTEITQCPINAGDSVITESVTLLREEEPIFNIVPFSTSTNNTDNTLLSTFVCKCDGNMRRVKVRSYITETGGLYTLTFYDKTNRVKLATGQFSNTDDNNLVDLGVISTPPEGTVTLELHVKKDSGSDGALVYVWDIVVYE